MPEFLGYLSESQIFVTAQLRHIPGEMCCIVFRPNDTACSGETLHKPTVWVRQKAEKHLFLCLL